MLDAPATTSFATLASGSWSAADDVLRSDGGGGLAEPWLALTAVPGAAFAVEADIRLVDLIENVCGQSFDSPGAAPARGSGTAEGSVSPARTRPARQG